MPALFFAMLHLLNKRLLYGLAGWSVKQKPAQASCIRAFRRAKTGYERQGRGPTRLPAHVRIVASEASWALVCAARLRGDRNRRADSLPLSVGDNVPWHPRAPKHARPLSDDPTAGQPLLAHPPNQTPSPL